MTKDQKEILKDKEWRERIEEALKSTDSVLGSNDSNRLIHLSSHLRSLVKK